MIDEFTTAADGTVDVTGGEAWIEMEYDPRVLQREVGDNARRKGFWQDPDGTDSFVATKLALIHSEVSEALEVWRTPEDKFGDEQHDQMAEELADIVIRVFDLAEYLDYDLWTHVLMKHDKNITRPVKHGKAF